jgi:preprotein translocase subunit YajC
MSAIVPGAIVVFAKAGHVDWTVESVSGDLVYLRSGMTNRRTTALAYELTLSPRQNTPDTEQEPPMSSTFQKGEEVVYQGTLKVKVVRQDSPSKVIIAFGANATKVVSPLELRRGEVETVEKL